MRFPRGKKIVTFPEIDLSKVRFEFPAPLCSKYKKVQPQCPRMTKYYFIQLLLLLPPMSKCQCKTMSGCSPNLQVVYDQKLLKII